MGRVRTTYRCAECGAEAPKWVGQCPGCGTWNTMHEEVAAPRRGRQRRGRRLRRWRQRVGPGPAASHRSAGHGPADRRGRRGQPGRPGPPASPSSTGCWAAASVPGSVTLVGGEPGIGKSTLLLQAAAAVRRRRATGALRLGRGVAPSRSGCGPSASAPSTPSLWLCRETTCRAGLAGLDAGQAGPRRRRLDPDRRSTRTCRRRRARSPRCATCAHRLVREAKERGVRRRARRPRHQGRRRWPAPGARARGRHRARLRGRPPPRPAPAAGGQAPVRLHRRAGPVRDDEQGLLGVPDAAACSWPTAGRASPARSSCPRMDGQPAPAGRAPGAGRPAPTIANPRRSAAGGRQRPARPAARRARPRARRRCANVDVFALAAGGVRVTEPGADLGLALAVASAATTSRSPADLVACGEVGLGGELRQVAPGPRRALAGGGPPRLHGTGAGARVGARVRRPAGHRRSGPPPSPRPRSAVGPGPSRA